MKQVPDWEPTDIWRQGTKFSRPDDLRQDLCIPVLTCLLISAELEVLFWKTRQQIYVAFTKKITEYPIRGMAYICACVGWEFVGGRV